jgi:hypothetical protein
MGYSAIFTFNGPPFAEMGLAQIMFLSRSPAAPSFKSLAASSTAALAFQGRQLPAGLFVHLQYDASKRFRLL